MEKDTVIKVEHVSKKYCRSLKRSMFYGLIDIGRNIIGMKSKSEHLRKDEFWALNDVSFEVKRGETLGIIGPNGSGKTTLLKLINGIFWPDKGKINIKGRVGAIIELGAGFHPMLTGKENIYINAAILGMTKKEIENKFDSIIEFAEIGDFIDTPVKYYSSGMYIKLGFSIAVHCEPDILLVDEVLGVGDARFWTKSINKMKELNKRGKTILIVTHNMWIIQNFCSTAMCIHKGKITIKGDPIKTILNYKNINRDLEDIYNRNKTLYKVVEITKFEVVREGEWASEREAYSKSGVKIIINAKVKKLSKIIFIIKVTSHDGYLYFSISSEEFTVSENNEIEAECNIPNFMLMPGDYFLWGTIFCKNEKIILAEEKYFFSVKSFEKEENSNGIFNNFGTWNIRKIK